MRKQECIVPSNLTPNPLNLHSLFSCNQSFNSMGRMSLLGNINTVITHLHMVRTTTSFVVFVNDYSDCHHGTIFRSKFKSKKHEIE